MNMRRSKFKCFMISAMASRSHFSAAPPARPRKRELSAHDHAEWIAYTEHVAPLPGRSPVLTTPKPVEPIPAPIPHATARPALPHPVLPPDPGKILRPTAATLAIGHAPSGLDTGSWQRFHTGRLPVSRTLDLHGRTVQKAFVALNDFLRRAHADQVRCVEIITGMGKGETGGRIRRELPLWLNSPALRGLVLAASHPHAANQGAVRLLLRRTR